MTKTVPSGLMLLVGASGSGKTTLVTNLINTGSITADAVITASKNTASPEQARADRDRRLLERLRSGMMTVVDDHNLDRGAPDAIAMAKRFDLPVTVVRFDPGHAVCAQRLSDSGRDVPGLVEQHRRLATLTAGVLEAAGVDVVIEANHEVPDIRVMPQGPLGGHLRGGFDVIGDVHGHLDALLELLAELGYDSEGSHPQGRIPVFVGDFVDKGPDPLGVLEFVMMLHRKGKALAVRGNHEFRLAKRLSGALTAANGSAGRFLRELTELSSEVKSNQKVTIQAFRAADKSMDLAKDVVRFTGRLPLHLVLDDGKLVVTHAGIRSDMIGRTPVGPEERREHERWCLYGITPGSNSRSVWAASYDGDATVVHGHDTVATSVVNGKVVSIDTGAGDGRTLSALSWPEMSCTSVSVSQVRAVA